MKMSSQNRAPTAPVERTSLGLRAALFDEIDSIRNGTSNPTRANAIAKLATTVVDSVRMEIEVSKYLRSIPPAEKEVTQDKLATGLIEDMKLA